MTVARSTTLLGLTAVAWLVALHQMQGMDMGYATELGPAASFALAWTAMMAAMMLPGAVPVIARHRRVGTFAAGYLAVWVLVGLAVYLVYAPHGSLAAGLVTVAAGLYELTPFKRHCRERCREETHSGLALGLHCVGSSIGLMAMFVALGVMNVAWMVVVTAIVLAQKLLPPRTAIDVPLALAIVALGLIVAV